MQWLPQSRLKSAALLLLALFFIGAGVSHFTNADFFLAIMPPYLPLHLELVYLSGVFEIAGGVAVLVPSIRPMAGWFLIAILIGVYPANIHMAVNPEAYVAQGTPLWGIYGRLPLQFVMIAWAWWASRPDPVETMASHRAPAAVR